MFQLSPGVNVSEIDQATGIPAVSTTQAAMTGVFRWGPVGQKFLVTSEPDLVQRTTKPTGFNAETWFVAASFLAYGQSLLINRVGNPTSAMAVFANTVAPNANTQTVNNSDVYTGMSFSSNVAYVARYPGDLGNSLRVSVCDSPNAYYKSVALVANSNIAASSNLAITIGSSNATVSIGFAGTGTQQDANTQAYAVRSSLQVGDNLKVGNNTVGIQYLKIASIGSVSSNSTIAQFNVTFASPYRLYSNWNASSLDRYWEFYNLVEGAPGTSTYMTTHGNTAALDQIHVVVVDNNGRFSGVAGTVLETYSALSRVVNAKTNDGTSIYYPNRINTDSKYIWWASDRAGAPSSNSSVVATATTDSALSLQMVGGTDGDDENTVSLGLLAQGFDAFKSAEDVDVSLVICGKSRAADGATMVNYVLDNVTTTRKDCVAFMSPPKEAVVNNLYQETDAVVAFANQLRDTSYGFMDSGYKYMYDKYNDVYRWVPLNGDMAGLCVRTDATNDPWWSPAGYTRGQIKNVVKLAYNPNKAQRDVIYKVSVNPVILQPGQGVILFGDKTLLGDDSPFSRINVRRLFIVIEKAISQDAKNTLFDFNDDFTQSQFRSRTVPYLRDIQGRRGLIDFKVVCDSSNNTDQVVDAEQFVGDIYLKPSRAINFIQLNFVSVRGSVQFTEIVGQGF